MDSLLPIRLGAVALDCQDMKMLSDFYIRMLGWVKLDESEDWIDIQSPDGAGIKIGFQLNPDYVPPVWPEEPDCQQQMAHLDFYVKDEKQMQLAVAHAVACGAKVAQMQYSDRWTVLFDPAGHPFCFCNAGLNE